MTRPSTRTDVVRVADYLAAHARDMPQSIALRELGSESCDRKPTDYRWIDLVGCVCDQVQQLLSLDLQAGDHVASWLPNSLTWIAIDLACQLRGMVHVALDKRLPADSVWELAVHATSRVLFVQPQDLHSLTTVAERACSPAEASDVRRHSCLICAPSSSGNGSRQSIPFSALADHSVHVSSDGPAQILYTSGTMREPKGVVLTHRNLLSNACGKLTAAPQLPTDVRLNILPFSHAYARTCELSTWLITGSQLCIAQDWNSFAQLAPRIEPTLVNLVPHLAIKLSKQLASGASPQSLLGTRLRLLQVGGAALPREDWDRLASAGWPPLQGYGLTETSPVVCSNHAGKQRPDCVGYAIPGVELRIDDAGVLWTRGPQVMAGYWNDGRMTVAPLNDGWFCTGDLAEMDADGAVRILGRSDDLITLSTGYKVSPSEITSRLQAEAWIESAVIVGQNQPYISALITPRWEQPEWTVDGLPAHTPPLAVTSIVMDAQRVQTSHPGSLEQWMLRRIADRLSHLPGWMQVRRVMIWDQPLTTENGGLNFKGAVRRRYVEEVMAKALVERLYESSLMT